MASDDSSDDRDERAPSSEGKRFLPPLEFGSIVVLLYFPALIHLGLMDDPADGERHEDLTLAKRNIDLLDLLKDRTKGNLDGEEEKFLAGVLDQLKMAYLKKADILKM